jgi:curli biogenesis system outer membrane secretion channel CsgG
MMKFNYFNRLALAVLLSGCATLDKSSVRAAAGAPDSSQVAEINIPQDTAYPMYAVAVQPLEFSSGSVSGTTIIDGRPSTVNLDYREADSQAHVITAQLITALSNVGNISLLDDSALSKGKDGLTSTKLYKGEKGPFLLKGMITEFNENAQSSEKNRGASLGGAGAIAGVAGAITGENALTWTGAGLAAANPTYEESQAGRTGMVAIDFQLIDGKTGRIVKAFNAKGTFSSATVSSGFSLFGIGGSNSEFASSVIGQAIRVAMNDAAEKTITALKTRGN